MSPPDQSKSEAHGAPLSNGAPLNDDAPRGRLPGHERRAQLLTVALEVFARKGYHATTMIDIAEAAGVTKPVLYQHFASKRSLYGTLLTDLGDRLGQAVVESASTGTTPREQAERGIKGYLEFVENDQSAFQFIFDGSNRRDTEWADIISEVEQSLAGAIAVLINVPGIAQSRREALAFGVMGMVESMTRTASSDQGSYDRDELVTDMTNLMWSGLRGLES